MWLINVESMQLEEFMVDPPAYAILSHTWGPEEVTFADFTHPDPLLRTRKRGWRKIEALCKLSAECLYRYVWVDTCCIDKSSSAELSEAINSMYAWYGRSEVCFAYLDDVSETPSDTLTRGSYFDAGSAFASSRWFRRGWTLQELISPKQVELYTKNWELTGSRAIFAQELSLITGIPEEVLLGENSALDYPVGVRLSWAAGRETTRPEDVAYSLLGLVDISMPLIYGEEAKAFLRLQEEILRQHEDDTLFLWCSPPRGFVEPWALRGMLADSPSEFAHFRDPEYYIFRRAEIPKYLLGTRPHLDLLSPSGAFAVDNRGVRYSGNLIDFSTDAWIGGTALLPLSYKNSRGYNACIYLEELENNRYARARPSETYSKVVKFSNRKSEEKIITAYKGNVSLRKLFSDIRYGYTERFRYEFKKSSRCQYGFFIRCNRPDTCCDAKLGLVWVSRHINGKPVLFRQPYSESSSRKPFIVAGPAENFIRLCFFYKNESHPQYFEIFFDRKSPYTSQSKAAEPETAADPAPESLVIFKSSLTQEFNPKDIFEKHVGEQSAVMTFAEARGVDGKPPRRLIVTNTSSRRPLSLSLMLDRNGRTMVWIIDMCDAQWLNYER